MENIKYQILNQVYIYDLYHVFNNGIQYDEWVANLNSLQLNNFLGLDINKDEVKNIKKLLINYDLLNCEDYKERVAAISKLKNIDGCYDLLDVICKPNFLNSKNFYKDLEMLSKADTARYGLRVLGEDSFINSPYHDEDLKLIVETHDTNTDEPLDYIVSDALATVAANEDSINSPYHQADMKLISTVGGDHLQPSHSYPEECINILATNKVSLKDKYHLENMKILARKRKENRFLYQIMTNLKIVNGPYYRHEIKALINAQSETTAKALYHYILDAIKDYYYDNREGYEKDTCIYSDSCAPRIIDSEYLMMLKRINEINDFLVTDYVNLLLNPDFLNSEYKESDLRRLNSLFFKIGIKDFDVFTVRDIFNDLCTVMTNKESKSSFHHKSDIMIISEATDERVRKILVRKATDKTSLESENHDYDMKYIFDHNIHLDPYEELYPSFIQRLYREKFYYLFTKNGMNDKEHKEKLEMLSDNTMINRHLGANNQLNKLLNKLYNYYDENLVDELEPVFTLKNKLKILLPSRKTNRNNQD